MSNKSRHLRRVSCTAITCLIAATLLHAGDIPVAPEGYKMVPVKVGDKTTYIQVQKEADPYGKMAAPSDGKYDPSAANFSRTSSYANKSFMTSSSSLTHSGSAQEQSDQRSFLTRAFDTGNANQNVPNLDKKITESNASAFNHSATGLDKSYADTLQQSSLAQKSSLLASNTSNYQGKTALLGAGHTDTYASTLAKPYLDPNMRIVRHEGAEQASMEGLQMKDLPNRPLTIDEVRALINHGTRPDTLAAPDAPSKALNDPGYMPDDAPTAGPTAPQKASSPKQIDDDKNDPLPSPGTMGLPPENSEPLPK